MNQAFKVLVCLHSRLLGTASPESKRRFSPIILLVAFLKNLRIVCVFFPSKRNGNSDLQDWKRRRHCPLNYCWQQKSGKAMHVMKSRNVWRQERRAISQMLSANLLCFPFFASNSTHNLLSQKDKSIKWKLFEQQNQQYKLLPYNKATIMACTSVKKKLYIWHKLELRSFLKTVASVHFQRWLA